MKYIKEYLEEVVHIKALGELTLRMDMDSASGLSGSYLIIDGYDTGIFIADADYCDWIEKKYTELKETNNN